ncbi:MAG: hypothetical protein HC830_05350 [Bacteroidetes bacterium]|nr:hypothetical protein [Bacteroidota bacterium]
MFQVVALSTFSQPVNLKVWPEGIPGSRPSSDYQEKLPEGMEPLCGLKSE